LTNLARYPEAFKDWDLAVALEPGPEQPGIRLERAGCLARAGFAARAFAQANALAGDPKGPPSLIYDAACVCALASAAVKSDRPLAEQYARRAVALLRQAVARGFGDYDKFKKDTDLASLRQREDFHALLAELEAKRPI
jgi:hypothetical protein